MRCILLIFIFMGILLSADIDDFEDEFIQRKPDFFETYNRQMTNINDFFFINLLNPLAKGYGYIIPKKARIGVENFFYNLLFPIRFLNNVLQLKMENAADEIFRFFFNTTIGIGGFIDVASSEFGIKKHDEDFGQTLGFYGVGSGAHIVLPLLGPSNLRDILGLGADYFIKPTSYLEPTYVPYAVKSYETINTTSLKGQQYELIRKDAFDLYILLRDGYEAGRLREIKE